MKIRKKINEGKSREFLLKEYFLNAYLIAMLKQVGAGVRSRGDTENAKFAETVAGQN